MCENKLKRSACFVFSLFAGFPGEGPEPHAAQTHSGLHRFQMGLTGQEAGERHMSVCVGGWESCIVICDLNIRYGCRRN